MASRGRPPLGDAKLTSAERKRRWDQLMRNADGADPSRPSRKPVMVYLDEEAIKALQERRDAHQYAKLPALTDSAFVEQLLKDSARELRSRKPAKGYSPHRHMELLRELVQQMSALEWSNPPLQVTVQRRRRDDDGFFDDLPVPAATRLPPANEDVLLTCMAAMRKNSSLNAKLARDLAAFGTEDKWANNIAQADNKIQGRLDEYLRAILGVPGW